MGRSAGTAARLARRVLLAAVAVARQVLFTAPACSMAVAVTVGLTESQGAVLRSRKYISISWGMIISNIDSWKRMSRNFKGLKRSKFNFPLKVIN